MAGRRTSQRGTAHVAYKRSPFRFWTGMVWVWTGMGMDRYGFDADALQRTASTHSYRQSGSGQPQLELLKSSSCIGLLPSSAARRIQTRSCALNGASAARCNQTEIPYMLKHPTHKAAATSRSCVLHRQRPTRKHVLNDLHFI